MLKKLFVGVLLLLFVCFLIYELLHLGPLLTNGKLGGGGGVLVAYFIRLIIIMEKHNTEHIMYIEM